MNEVIFPQYRKYRGLDTWFEITGEREFTEVMRVGNRYVVHRVKAVQFPEIQRIKDMITCYEGRWQITGREFFLKVLALAGDQSGGPAKN